MANDTSEPTKSDEDYSPSSTVINFDRPIPLLRGPLAASPSDDPSAGPYVLAFKNSQAWASSFITCERKIVQQCEEGARIGCAINASSKCKPPWWKSLSSPKLSDLKEREVCEVREMEECFSAAKEACVGLARDKCLVPFRDARIKVEKGVLNSKVVVKLIGWASMPQRTKKNLWVTKCLVDDEFGMITRSFRASELLGFDDYVQSILRQQQQGAEN